MVRNGHAPEREIQTGIGPIAVRRPKLRDRGDGTVGEPIRFTSKVLPPFLRRTRNVEELLPWLYLKGVSTGQFEEALTALLGPDAPGLSASTLRRLVATWQQEHERWQDRDLSTRRYVYVWADGVYFTPRLDHDRQCMLVLIGADAAGRKELLAIEDGYRESTQSWRELIHLDGARRIRLSSTMAAPPQSLAQGGMRMRASETRLIIAFTAGVITTMASLSAGATGSGECSEETRSALAPFVGDWSFATEHSGVVGAPPSAGIGTLTIDHCGFVSGLQLSAVTAPEFHAELEASLSGQFLPFELEENIIVGPITFTIEQIRVNPPGPVDLTGGSATQVTGCVGMLKANGRFLEARCVETEDETVEEEDIFPQATLVTAILKRTSKSP